MALLSEPEFRATLGTRMIPLSSEQAPPFDFWPYFAAIPERDFAGHDFSVGAVENVYRDAAGRFEHVLVSSRSPNVFLALVLDLRESRVLGHHVLNLRVLYGLDA